MNVSVVRSVPEFASLGDCQAHIGPFFGGSDVAGSPLQAAEKLAVLEDELRQIACMKTFSFYQATDIDTTALIRDCSPA